MSHSNHPSSSGGLFIASLLLVGFGLVSLAVLKTGQLKTPVDRTYGGDSSPELSKQRLATLDVVTQEQQSKVDPNRLGASLKAFKPTAEETSQIVVPGSPTALLAAPVLDPQTPVPPPGSPTSTPAPSTPAPPTPAPAPSTPAPSTPAPSTPAPATPAPATPAPATPAPSTPVPSTPVPSTPVPSTPAPSTPAPSTPVPSTPAPSTPAPSTPAPSTPAPSTPAPSTPVPSTPVPAPAPSTPAPVPSTPAPQTPAPQTPAPPASAPQTPAPVPPSSPAAEIALPTDYKVVAGDSLSKIGDRFKLDWKLIAEWNNLKEPFALKEGETLRLKPIEAPPQADPDAQQQ